MHQQLPQSASLAAAAYRENRSTAFVSCFWNWIRFTFFTGSEKRNAPWPMLRSPTVVTHLLLRNPTKKSLSPSLQRHGERARFARHTESPNRVIKEDALGLTHSKRCGQQYSSGWSNNQMLAQKDSFCACKVSFRIPSNLASCGHFNAESSNGVSRWPFDWYSTGPMPRLTNGRGCQKTARGPSRTSRQAQREFS